VRGILVDHPLVEIDIQNGFPGFRSDKQRIPYPALFLPSFPVICLSYPTYHLLVRDTFCSRLTLSSVLSFLHLLGFLFFFKFDYVAHFRYISERTLRSLDYDVQALLVSLNLVVQLSCASATRQRYR